MFKKKKFKWAIRLYTLLLTYAKQICIVFYRTVGHKWIYLNDLIYSSKIIENLL